jgi:hypothetical protein
MTREPEPDRAAQLEALVTVARHCRAAQRLYYRHRDKDSLILAKRAEADLDRQLAALGETPA